jgi:uncharacterized protein (TIGR00290 family)
MMALDTMKCREDIEITALLVTMSNAADRVAMHAVRRALVEAQADRLGIPIKFIEIPSPCPNEIYEAQMDSAIKAAVADSIEHIIFGDLFLADVRSYREERLAGTGVSPLFPLWNRPTDALAKALIERDVRAVVTCVDPAQIPASFVGRFFDASLLADLPADVDPCGERGEFHTFVFDAPGFSSAIDIEIGGVVERDGFVFCDVKPT